MKHLILLLPLIINIATVNIAAAADHPNIVYILADDMGYGDVQILNPEHGKIPTLNTQH